MRAAVTMTVLVSLSLSFSVALAQRFGQDLQGMLTVRGGGAPPRFVVLRLQELGATIQETVANDRRFAFGDLGPGRYTIVVEAAGFEKASVDVDFPYEGFVMIQLAPLRPETGRAETVPLSQLAIPESARRQFAAGKKKVEENRCTDAFDHLKK